MNLTDLKKEIPYKWRVQECKEHGANCVAYIDARQVMDILDEVVGVANWQSKYESHNNNLYCAIGIKVNEDWVWKTDCGAESNIEKEKGEASDALKRAAVQWGIGRFLYNLPIVKLKTKQHTNQKWYPATNDGKILWNKEDLSDYINSLGKQTTPQVKELPWLPDAKVKGIIDWAKKEGKTFEQVMTELQAKYRVNKNNEESLKTALNG